MPVVTPEQLAALQQHGDNVRNICVLAHVDHGKTSLTDALIATNGIISPKMAGKIRYLDSRPDEQLRGITMESSAISLLFSMMRRSNAEATAVPVAQDYLVNLIDSPGHIDFSSEVSTASRLCDGAVVLVDAVEGVCSQTVTVLRQTWVEKLKPLLVINKMDRLVTELQMTPSDAYVHISKLLEQVNAVLGSFFQGERMEEDLHWRERMDERVAAAKAEGGVVDVFEEKDDEDIYFAPEKNNVIFSSAVDGWACTVRQFAVLYERKLGIKSALLEKVLWGQFYLDPKTKKVLGAKHLKGRHLKPMFVQLVLEPIWAVYHATMGGVNTGATGGLNASSASSSSSSSASPEALDKICKSLGITIAPHVRRSRDPRLLMTTVFAAWLPLSTALLVSVIESLPSPRVAQAARIDDLLDRSPDADHIDPAIRHAMVHFDAAASQPVVAYVSKMVSVPASELPEHRRSKTTANNGLLSADEAREMARQKRAEIARAAAAAAAAEAAVGGDAGADELELVNAFAAASLTTDTDTDTQPAKHDPEHLVGFARIYSGTLSVGDEIYVLPPKYSPAHPHRPQGEPVRVTVQALYMLMGRNLEALDRVPAGVVFGIRGLDRSEADGGGSAVLKSATLCSRATGAPNLAGVARGSTTTGAVAGRPIVRVALEPENPADLDRMIAGLRLLVQSDPCAEYEQFGSGEHVLLTAGELHLERCLTDLRERFARCEIQAGEAIVPYRETIVRADEMRPPASKERGRGVVQALTSSRQVAVTVRVRPLPAGVTEFLGKNPASVRGLSAATTEGGAATSKSAATIDDDEDEQHTQVLSAEELKTQLQALFDGSSSSSGKQAEAWKGVTDRIAAFGPRRVGPNVLVDGTATQCLHKVFGGGSKGTTKKNSNDKDNNDNNDNNNDDDAIDADEVIEPAHFADKIVYAFQLAMAQGPLCHEPVQGVAVVVEDIQILGDNVDGENATLLVRDGLGRLTGEVIKTTQQIIHKGFLDWSPRLMLAMYSCEIQASTDVLGRVYDVLTRRRGRVLSETMKEGTPFFTIVSLLPVAESFGFADEMRKRTSGAAQPQLIFAGFEVLDEDPHWVPFTEDDLEDLGEFGDRENVAKRYMDRVRRRKGLLVAGRNVARDAEKQKTLKR